MAKTVLLVGYDDFGFLDVVGPADVFTIANQRAGTQLYDLSVTAPSARPIRAESGLRLGVDVPLAQADPPHTLVVSGGNGFVGFVEDRRAMDQLRRLAEGAERIVSVCTGAFALAAIGALSGRKATTHWAHVRDLARRFPDVAVVDDELFVRSDTVVTAAGMAAGIDLALALVAEDHGAELAREVSRRMVVYLERSGSQAQFSERLTHSVTTDDDLDRVLAAITADPRGHFTNAALADMLSVSERHLSRMFRERTGTTPARWINRVRVDHARERLEHGRETVPEVAAQVGFASVDTMRQAFERVLGLSPQQYRQRHLAMDIAD